MKKLRKNKRGVTLAEMMVVVGIIAILGGVVFIAVWNHQRSLGQLERDGIAKEIFVAAQNHLTPVYGQGYLGLSGDDFGTEDKVTKDKAGKDIDGDYYFIVNNETSSAKIFDYMLPFGSVDETVRAGGSYIVHYQKDTGLVLDVFFCTKYASPDRFNHILNSTEYDTVIGLRDNKPGRRTYAADNSILGWYGGTDAALIPTTPPLNAPTIKVVNAEKLYVEISNTNSSGLLQLIITGVDSKAQKAYELRVSSIGDRVRLYGSDYTVILDDITADGMHFADITADTVSTTGNFIPGENIEIQAVAYSNSTLSNIAYSAKNTTNSLFGSINSAKDTAHIGNIRHLENLDKTISKLDKNDTSNKLNISKAEQTDSFSWIDFQKANKKIDTKSTGDTESDSGFEKVGVFAYSDSDTAISTVIGSKGYFMPVEPNYPISYDGQSHSISDVAVNITKDNSDDIGQDAGLFGSTSTVSKIANLELIDFSITGMKTAGALAGTLTGCTVTNVLARNKDNSAANRITATTDTDTGDAGGLIGNLTSGAVQYSAAAVIVNGGTKGTAGGLIGNAAGTITGCYSGGHTAKGSYNEWVKSHPYDVTGVTAGGLVGVGSSSATIRNSYSTCSVSGTTAGGFAGSASGAITNSYATGYIDPNATTKYAFVAGSLPPGSTGNWYYRTINEVTSAKQNAKPDETEPMLPYQNAGDVSNHISYTQPIDLNESSYNDFVGQWDDWNPARAYDPTLVKYFSGKYTLKTVDELIGAAKPPPSDKPNAPDGYANWNELFVSTHYGDWPSPEVFFINEPSPTPSPSE